MRLKILFVNNFLTLGAGGGPTRYMLSVKKSLEEKGHKVATFTINESGTSPDYSIPPLDFNVITSKNIFKKVKNGLRSIYNIEARRRIDQALGEFRPDIVHCHNIYNHITPSILPVIKAHNIPVVMTLHDLKLACPNHRMFTEGRICERCRRHRYYQAFFHRCFLDSRSASLVGSLEAYVHYLRGYFLKNIEVFISPSQFLRQKLVEWGMPSEKIVTLNNAVPAQSITSAPKSNQLLYFGIVSEIKGVFVLLDAMSKLNNKAELLIAGEGPERVLVNKMIHKEGLSNVRVLGFLDGNELSKLIQDSLVSIVPSLWYENQPFTILEAMANGRPVVASNIGGIPEMVVEGRNGLLFTPGNSFELAEKLDWIIDHRLEAQEMGEQGYQMVKDRHTPDKHYLELINLYRGLVDV